MTKLTNIEIASTASQGNNSPEKHNIADNADKTPLKTPQGGNTSENTFDDKSQKGKPASSMPPKKALFLDLLRYTVSPEEIKKIAKRNGLGDEWIEDVCLNKKQQEEKYENNNHFVLDINRAKFDICGEVLTEDAIKQEKLKLQEKIDEQTAKEIEKWGISVVAAINVVSNIIYKNLLKLVKEKYAKSG